MPFSAQASFFSSLLSNEALAQTNTTNNPAKSDDNSQTIALLQANVLPAPVSKSEKTKDSQIDTNAKVSIVSDNALLPATGPMDVGGPDILEVSSEDQISVYVVRKGDSLSAVAEMFGVSVDTILSANDMKKGDKLAEGDILFILPISGVEHTVLKGETLQSIAKLYKVDINDIVVYNDITTDTVLAVGDTLIIPGAEIPSSAPNTTPKSNQGKSPYYATGTFQNVSGYFINPVPEMTRKSQGPHGPGRRGVDLAAPTGARILASATGRVLLARVGYNGGYGTLIIIQHPNGTKTLYAHLSRLGTQTGAEVSQGQIIGYVGSTGRSTGPHLHFEVFNAKNPGFDWSWKK